MPKELADRWRASERPVSCEQIWQPSLGYMNTSHSWKVSQFIKAHTWCSALLMDATLSYLYVIPEPLGGVRNLRVTDPTTSTLTVQWEPAEGSVRQYRIFYVPAAGGVEDMVSKTLTTTFSHLQWNNPDMMYAVLYFCTGAGIRQYLQYRPEEPGFWYCVHCVCGSRICCWRRTAHVWERQNM